MSNDENESLLPIELCEEIKTRVFQKEGFIRLTQSLSRGGQTFRISLRPVMIKGEQFYQAEMIDSGKTQVRNLTEVAARKGLNEILEQKGRRDLHLVSTDGDLHLRVTKRGKALISRGKAKDVATTAPLQSTAHDRVKKQPLTAFDATTLLKVIGLADVHGEIKPSMRGKYDQVNALLRCVESILPENPPAIFTIVDCGCGKAYLTLAMQQYLTHAKGFHTVKIIGIDRNESVIASAINMAESLGISEDATFLAKTIQDVEMTTTPDLVMSLHACDTATDDALILAVKTKAARILCVPCCQHELHHALEKGDAMRAVLRHGILRERLADLLTDTFRAQVLRICGYRANVMEFVNGEATARNILIRAEKGLRPGIGEAIEEYEALKDFWGVNPYIGKLLLDEQAND